MTNKETLQPYIIQEVDMSTGVAEIEYVVSYNDALKALDAARADERAKVLEECLAICENGYETGSITNNSRLRLPKGHPEAFTENDLKYL